ncbi:hypothetical protein [Mongoliitalea daihaiensis]|uniref:hypothetical protein n=1 Tax=Mongoliitalea daihaiensis TaxID=2782006 RepID=UPI001F33B2AD|nr:hypothetical protein [Mongoliitalea daihaiensis]UJP64919.1 hypothetical protein IPZ59_19360 [Mongoliitalea daihaiensis]
MKSFMLLTLFSYCIIHSIDAQVTGVRFNIISNEINNNRALPSEERFYITGQLPTGVEMVSLDINRTGKRSIQSYNWRKAFDFETNDFELLVSEPLRNNENYDLVFQYFIRADEQQIDFVNNAITKNLEAYVRGNFEVRKNGIKSNNGLGVVQNQLEQIVIQGLMDYRNFLGRDFNGFSDVVVQKLNQSKQLKLRRAKFSILKKSSEDNSKAVYADNYLEELVATLSNEVRQYLGNNLLVLADERKVLNYITEKKQNSLPLNFGYATIPIKRQLSSTEYLHGPYVGFSVPLGNRNFTKFLGNASFSTGVFLTNFEASSGESIKGDLIGLPIYAGLGYKVFQVFRFNVGAVMLNMDDLGSGPRQTYIQPFAGLSLEFNLWLGLKNRR